MDKINSSTVTNDTKKLLMDVSTRLFNEKNFDDVSVNEICREAGVTKGAFYHYFDSKYDIPIQQYREIQDRFFSDYLASADRPFGERFYRVIMWFSDYCTLDKLNIFKNYYKALLVTDKSRVMRRTEMTTRVLKEMLCQGVAIGVFRKNININFVTETVTRFIFSLVLDWTIFNGEIDLQKELAYLYRNTLYMISVNDKDIQ